MNRVTQRPLRNVARQIDVGMVLAAHAAVDRAMEKFHEDNPAGYHAQRKALWRCPFDPACPFTKE